MGEKSAPKARENIEILVFPLILGGGTRAEGARKKSNGAFFPPYGGKSSLPGVSKTKNLAPIAFCEFLAFIFGFFRKF